MMGTTRINYPTMRIIHTVLCSNRRGVGHICKDFPDVLPLFGGQRNTNSIIVSKRKIRMIWKCTIDSMSNWSRMFTTTAESLTTTSATNVVRIIGSTCRCSIFRIPPFRISYKLKAVIFIMSSLMTPNARN